MMKLIRSENGRNDFSITGLTLGKVMAIRDTLNNAPALSPVAVDVQDFLNRSDLDNIESCGESHMEWEWE